MRDLLPKLAPALMIVLLVVSVDTTLFRGHEWTPQRLAVNIGIVLVVGALFSRFMRRG